MRTIRKCTRAISVTRFSNKEVVQFFPKLPKKVAIVVFTLLGSFPNISLSRLIFGLILKAYFLPRLKKYCPIWSHIFLLVITCNCDDDFDYIYDFGYYCLNKKVLNKLQNMFFIWLGGGVVNVIFRHSPVSPCRRHRLYRLPSPRPSSSPDSSCSTSSAPSRTLLSGRSSPSSRSTSR